MDEKVAKAVAWMDGFHGAEPFDTGPNEWQTIRARLVELEAENERLRKQVTRANRDLMDERYSVPSHLSENGHE